MPGEASVIEGEIERVRGPGRWPLAVRAGQFLFLSGQLPVDPDTGLTIAGYADVPREGRATQTTSLLVDGQEGPMAAQVWWVYDRIGQTLRQQGSSLDDVLLLTGWLTDFRQWPVMNRIRQRTFGEGHYPPSTTFQVPGLGAEGAVTLFETFALAAGPLRKEPLGSARQVGYYFPGARVGSLLFLAGEVPADPERGLVVRGYADLDAEGQALATGQLGPDGWEGRIRAQAWFVYQRIRRLLEANGSSLRHVVKQNVYLRDPRDFPAFEGISRRALGAQLPATTVVHVDEYGHRDFSLEVEVVAVTAAAPSPERLEVGGVPTLGPGYPLAVAAEPFVYLSGQLPLDPGRRAIVSDMPAGGGLAELAARQTAQLYANARAVLAELDLGLDALVRQVLHVSEPSVLPAVEAVAAAATRAAPPATTVVQVRSIWPRPALVQADFTAYTGDRPPG
jgi:enamine deaminase RidA (YjgF/YER057c/UK114 family)